MGISKRPATRSSSSQKKPSNANSSLPPRPSRIKKQKTTKDSSDYGFENLNDVIPVTAVNLEEEKEQLFSSLKVGNSISDTSHESAEEDKSTLFLNKIPLQKKLADIMAKFDLKSLSNDVEPCISHFTEQRLRDLIRNIIQMSKQRIDSEKSIHNVVLTSEDRDKVLAQSRETRKEWIRKQAEMSYMFKHVEDNSAVDVQTLTEGCRKATEVKKVHDVTRHLSAANAAIRDAVGGSDALSRWQIMSKARPKNVQAATPQNLPTSGEVRQSSRLEINQDDAARCTAAQRKMSIKDVISVLERDPRMAKSTRLYRLYLQNTGS